MPVLVKESISEPADPKFFLVPEYMIQKSHRPRSKSNSCSPTTNTIGVSDEIHKL